MARQAQQTKSLKPVNIKIGDEIFIATVMRVVERDELGRALLLRVVRDDEIIQLSQNRDANEFPVVFVKKGTV